MEDRRDDSQQPQTTQDHSTGVRDRGHNQWQPSYSQQNNPFSKLDGFTQKAIVYLLGLLVVFGNSFLLYRFSQEFDTRFDKRIKSVINSIEQSMVIRDYKIDQCIEINKEQEAKLDEIGPLIGGKGWSKK